MATQGLENLSEANFGQVVEQAGEMRLVQAKERDSRVRELERQHVATWSEMAELCAQVEEFEDWRILGFESYGLWLKDAAPQSRSAMYAARGLLQELKELPKETLRQVPLGSAKLLAKVPKARRTKKLLAKATTQRPSDFRETIQEQLPDLHIEGIQNWTFKFTKSQRKKARSVLDMVKMIDAEELLDDEDLEDYEMSDEDAMEYALEAAAQCMKADYEKIKKGE
jgi:hypothetical protein